MNIQQDESSAPDFDETRWSKRLLYSTDTANTTEDEELPQRKRQKIMLSKKKEQDLSTVKIKTLAEIRAERRKQEKIDNLIKPSLPEHSSNNEAVADSEITISEVSSTSKMEDDENVESEAKNTNETFVKPMKRKPDVVQEVRKKPKLRRTPQLLQIENVASSLEESIDSQSQTSNNPENENVKDRDTMKDTVTEEAKVARADSVDSGKLDEMLLLDEDDFESSNVSLQAEEDLLKDIDDILSD